MTSSSRSDDWRLRAGAAVAAGLVRLLGASVRIRHVDDGRLRDWERSGRRFILAFWHRHLLLMPYAYRGERISVLVSRHRDGEWIARIVARLGIDSSRGSTTRGGAMGLRELLRKAHEGYDLAFTPDGPRGPAGVVKPGVLLAAAATSWAIQPVAMAASRASRLRSWDRFVVPWPGSRVVFAYGEPLRVERGTDMEARAGELAGALDALERRAQVAADGRES